MFRYFCFHWDPAHPAQAARAQALDVALQRAAGWQPALASDGLRAYTIGSRLGVNGVYPLPSDQGVVLGRLFRREDRPAASADVDLSANEGARILRTEARALVDDYWGRYVAVLRSNRGGAQVLRDPSGALPCFHVDVEGVAVVFSWLEDLLAFTPDRPVPAVDWGAIAAELSLGHLGGSATALAGITQILPGRLVPLGDDDTPTVTLWRVVDIARRPADDAPGIAAARLRQTVIDCVQAWASCHGSILLRLSGGVDSAIVLGCLAATSDQARVTCLNYHSPGSDSDERGYARLAATQAGVDLVEKARDSAIRLDDILTVSRTPTPEAYLGRFGTGRVDAEVASLHGARAMFTGSGGDQLFFQLRCTWPAADYLSVHGPGRAFVRAALDAARLGRVSLWRSMRDAVSGPAAIDTTAPLDRYVHPDLLRAADLPIGKFHQVQALIDPFGYYDSYLREAAPELVSPLLSQPLVELCLALPTWTLTHGGRGRALARRAFACELPREIATRQSKGGMEEHVEALLRHNLPFARELLLDGHLVRRGLLDRRKVEAALAGRLSAADGHVGEIHQGMAVEAWLQRVTAPAGR
jgi:asparagine synthase (glutamine-hydrolysing)